MAFTKQTRSSREPPSIPSTRRMETTLRRDLALPTNWGPKVIWSCGADSACSMSKRRCGIQRICDRYLGDFFGGPGIGPGEPFNMQLAGKIIF
jgi:hypothetical protein